jgi:hypothetical protein
MLLYMCHRPHATIYPHAAVYLSSCCNMCALALMLLTYASSCYYLCVLMLLYAGTGAGSLRVAWRENLLSSRAHEEHR